MKRADFAGSGNASVKNLAKMSEDCTNIVPKVSLKCDGTVRIGTGF